MGIIMRSFVVDLLKLHNKERELSVVAKWHEGLIVSQAHVSQSWLITRG